MRGYDMPINCEFSQIIVVRNTVYFEFIKLLCDRDIMMFSLKCLTTELYVFRKYEKLFLVHEKSNSTTQ